MAPCLGCVCNRLFLNASFLHLARCHSQISLVSHEHDRALSRVSSAPRGPTAPASERMCVPGNLVQFIQNPAAYDDRIRRLLSFLSVSHANTGYATTGKQISIPHKRTVFQQKDSGCADPGGSSSSSSGVMTSNYINIERKLAPSRLSCLSNCLFELSEAPARHGGGRTIM